MLLDLILIALAALIAAALHVYAGVPLIVAGLIVGVIVLLLLTRPTIRR